MIGMTRYRRALTTGAGTAVVFAFVTVCAGSPAQTISASAELAAYPTGVMDNSAPGDHKVTDAISEQEMAFQDWIRQMRIDRQEHQVMPSVSP